MNYKLIITIISDKDHYPIRLNVAIPEELARLIQATPVRAINLVIEESPGYVSKIPLLDYKQE